MSLTGFTKPPSIGTPSKTAIARSVYEDATPVRRAGHATLDRHAAERRLAMTGE
jgi:hypothetical protein